MKLEINQTIVAEDADADDIKDALRVLSQEDEAFITLWESDDVFLQAAGVPATGYVMSYHNGQTGEELTSKNQALKPQAVMRTFTSYVRGNWDWRNTVGWQPTGEYAGRTVSTGAALRRGLPLFLAILFFTIAIVPLVMGTKAVVDQVVFKPLCEQYAPDIDHFQHGSGNGNVSTPYTPGRCWYKDAVNVALKDIVGNGGVLIDTAGSFIQVIVPIVVIVVIELAGFIGWRGRRKPRTAS